MDEFVCEAITSDDSITPEHEAERNKIISTQKKLRRTEELFQILSTSRDADDTESKVKSKTARNTRIRKNLFLPKILDTQKVSVQTGFLGNKNRDSLLKKKTALKLVQRKIEAKISKNKKPKVLNDKLKPDDVAESLHKTRTSLSACNVVENLSITTIPTILRGDCGFNIPIPYVSLRSCSVSQSPVVHKKPEVKKQLYIPLVPLEKTNLLNKDQLQQLQHNISRENYSHKSILHQEDELAVRNNIATSVLRSCKVVLERLTFEQIQRIRNSSKCTSFIGNTNDHTLNHFIPSSTSSPLGQSQLCKSIATNNDHDHLEPSTIGHDITEDINATYTINNFSDTKVTFRRNRPLLQSKVETKNSFTIDTPVPEVIITLDDTELSVVDESTNGCNKITRIDYLKTPQTPKSALKSSKPKTVSNRAVRRVTFSDTSIIIIDDSYTSPPYKSHRKLHGIVIPTRFSVVRKDREKSVAQQLANLGHTPFYAKPRLSSTFSLSPLITQVSSSPKQLFNKTSTSLRKFSVVKEMPNFASIHQKLFSKMLDIKEHSRQKQERSKWLLSGQKPRMGSESYNNSGPQLKFSDESLNFNAAVSQSNGTTRFGFKSQTAGNSTKSIEIDAVANKTKPLKSLSQNMKMEIKGVRSNRRFELLMKMRLNKKVS